MNNTFVSNINGKEYQLDEIKNGLSITRSGHLHYFPDEYKKRKREGACYHGHPQEWYFLGRYNGKILHRVNEPETIFYDPYISRIYHNYYFNGFCIDSTLDYCFLCGMDELETLKWVLKHGDQLQRCVIVDLQ